MIIFQKIQFRNFLSVGNKEITYDFVNGTKSLIIGKNGSGKSLLEDALCFALFNKGFRKCNKDQLVNSINGKQLEVTLEFETGGKSYKIERGVKPNYAYLYINGDKRDQEASAVDFQKWFESNIIRMNERTFRQMVILGSSSFVPFMRLASWQRRGVIEDLLELTVFTQMREVIKSDSNELKVQYENVLKQIEIITTKIEAWEENVNSLDNSNVELITQKTEEKKSLQRELKDLEATYTSKVENFDEKKITDLQTESNVLADKKDELTDLITKIRHNAKRANKELKFFTENERCTTCGQDIPDEIKSTIFIDNEETLKDLTIAEKQLNGMIEHNTAQNKKIVDEIAELRKESASIVDLIYSIDVIKQSLESIGSTIESLESGNVDEVTELRTRISDSTIKLKELNTSSADLQDKSAIYTYIASLLKDDGIKSKVIKTYLPIINKLIRKYLDIMEFNVDFRFDEFFNETIKAQYKDNFSYSNFSEGQKLRIDLCLLFTWRELSRMKNSVATNLIIMDEIGESSLDAEGFDAFMKILGVDRDKQCYYIISHSPEKMAHGMDKIFEAKMVNNFTEIHQQKG